MQESQLYRKRQALTVKIRRRDFDILQKERRQQFIKKYNPDIAPLEITQWRELIQEFQNTQPKKCLSVLNKLKACSRSSSILEWDHSRSFFQKLQLFTTQKYDLEEEQQITSWILAHVAFSQKVCFTIYNQTQIVSQIIRRLKVFGDVQLKDNYLWILNHMQKQFHRLSEILIQNGIVDIIANYFREQPEHPQLIESLKTILIVIYGKIKDDYRHFSKLTSWLLQFCSIQNQQILCYSTSILSVLSQLQYGQVILVEIHRWKFFKRIANAASQIKVINKSYYSLFLTSFVILCRRYFSNPANHVQLLSHIDIIRVFRMIMSVENIDDTLYHNIFETLVEFATDPQFSSKIVKDQLFARMMYFYLNSVGAIHVSSIKSIATLCLSLTELTSQCDNLYRVKNCIIGDINMLHQQFGQYVDQINELSNLMDLAITHIESLYKER